MKKTIKKNIERGILLGLACAIMMSFARFDNRCEELRNGVLRLHILANSDTESDQQVKLKVRDKILKIASFKLDEATDVNSAIDIVSQNIDEITDIANSVLSDNGFGYTASVSVEKDYFENRQYDDFTLPAGVYNSLTVRLGKAEGHNWWCVVFPGVCLPACEDKLERAVSKTSAKTAKNGNRYRIKFKTVEMYENIKRKISNVK